MSEEPVDDLLAACAEELRVLPEPEAPALRARASEAVRRTALRSWWVRSSYPDGSSPGMLRVSDRAVVSAIRLALAAVPGVRPLRVVPAVAGHDCVGVRLDVSVGYGRDLPRAAHAARAATAAALEDALGTRPPVDVTVVDVDA